MAVDGGCWAGSFHLPVDDTRHLTPDTHTLSLTTSNAFWGAFGNYAINKTAGPGIWAMGKVGNFVIYCRDRHL